MSTVYGPGWSSRSILTHRQLYYVGYCTSVVQDAWSTKYKILFWPFWLRKRFANVYCFHLSVICLNTLATPPTFLTSHWLAFLSVQVRKLGLTLNQTYFPSSLKSRLLSPFGHPLYSVCSCMKLSVHFIVFEGSYCVLIWKETGLNYQFSSSLVDYQKLF
jgi:hypothetical protein